ncbi:hypothetical protein MPSEU_000480500 [Mayamaea pseudoterrestris]|nr:hypothetical protein MPSEU_000480500 [Mayamaea pseudoterrestris]
MSLIAVFLTLFLFMLTQLGCASRPVLSRLEDGYSFDKYVDDFGKIYASDEEFQRRKAIFDNNLQFILDHNAQSLNKLGGYLLGINYFADLHLAELPLGYDKKPSRMLKNSQQNSSTSAQRILKRPSLPMVVEPVSRLPDQVDWRTKGVTTPVKNQGMCGSCWAFASTAVLESHIAIQTDILFELSEQQIVSCASNPMHCGGLGGCTGATAEIAFDHVLQNGIVSEYSFGYQSGHGENVTCSLPKRQASIRSAPNQPKKAVYADSVAMISGYVSLESNNYEVLMNAVAKLGPVAVSVAAHPWMFYQSGVMSVPINSTGATDINHLVVLEGYGTDTESGEDYWLIRNSWSPLWGERGYIRLQRTDPKMLQDPDSACGMDVTPSHGDACTIDTNGREIEPPAVRVCGASGILYAAAVPIGGYLL